MTTPDRPDPSRLTAVELRALMAAGRASAQDVAQACLARTAQREPQVRAWAWHDPQAVMAQARALDEAAAAAGQANETDAAGEAGGVQGGAAAGRALHGIPVGVKDIIDTRDMPTEYGSAWHAGHRPQADAGVVASLRAAGAVIFGKTVTTEFAYVHAGPTANPHDLGHTPGGSSSGSAAAVADFMVPMALATQTGGSTIRPAAYCGVVGFKPTLGVVALDGVKPLSGAMDTIGVHARCVADAALLYEVLRAGPQGAAQVRAPQPGDAGAGQAEAGGRQARGHAASAPRLAAWRIAYCPGPHAGSASDDARRVLEEARALLAAAGAQVEPLELPEAYAGLSEANRIVMAYEAARNFAREYENGRERLGAATVALIESGQACSESDYRGALALARECAGQHAALMRERDALLTFSAPGEAPPRSEGTGDSLFNRAWTTMGVPCLTLPAGRGRRGLPLGVQLVGAAGADDALLQLGRYVEDVLAERARAGET